VGRGNTEKVEVSWRNGAPPEKTRPPRVTPPPPPENPCPLNPELSRLLLNMPGLVNAFVFSCTEFQIGVEQLLESLVPQGENLWPAFKEKNMLKLGAPTSISVPLSPLNPVLRVLCEHALTLFCQCTFVFFA